MNWLLKILLLICVLVQSVKKVRGNPQNIANLFYGSNLVKQNPAISMGCFSDYILNSREISEAYSRNYNKCLLDAQADRKSTDDKMMDKRLAIGESSENICRRLSECDGLNTILEVFHCHALIGANNTKDVYTISGNASELTSVLQENYRQIDLRHEQCTKKSEREYVESTGSNYRALQSCLDGNIKPLSLAASKTTKAVNINITPMTSLTKLMPLASDTEVQTNPENIDATALEAAELNL